MGELFKSVKELASLLEEIRDILLDMCHLVDSIDKRVNE